MAKRKASDAAAASAPAAPAPAAVLQASTSAPVVNKERVLIVSSRGITSRSRHLLLDFLQLLPNSKKDPKLDTKSDRGEIAEVAAMRGCTTALFFETRKHQDLYLWMAKTPSGPTVKFHVTNVHTMAELKLSGNHLKGSRPVVSFDASFDEQPHLQVLKELLAQTFATPRRHHRTKPFFDHVISFSVVDGRIWMRNYQVVPDPTASASQPEAVSLVEVGPRASLQPIKMFAGAFGGKVIYENPMYVSPNALRAALRRKNSGTYKAKAESRAKRVKYVAEHQVPADPLKDAFK